MCSLSTFLYNKLDINILQTLCSKQIRRKHLSGKLHIGDVSKFVLMFANGLGKYSLGFKTKYYEQVQSKITRKNERG